MFSPRFKSVAEMAGWDEDSLLLASLVVEDTPDRNAKNKKRSPPSTSRRKRRARRRSSSSMSIAVFDLDDDEPTNNTEKGNANKVECIEIDSAKKVEIDQGNVEKGTSVASSSSMTLPCVDRLREELSCAICLDICFEPSTTPCGHSFCMKCLKNAADKCGKRCPKCRQLISNGRSCTINTVLWNTIQLLFPVEVEARKAAEPSKSTEAERIPETTNQSGSNIHFTRRLSPMVSSRRDGISLTRREEGSRNPETTNQYESNLRVTRRLRTVGSSTRDSISLYRHGEGSRNRGRGVATQDEDAALPLRLQREEFMNIYRESSLARNNLRAMNQRLHVRNQAV